MQLSQEQECWQKRKRQNKRQYKIYARKAIAPMKLLSLEIGHIAHRSEGILKPALRVWCTGSLMPKGLQAVMAEDLQEAALAL